MARLIQIGSSKGVRIPKALIEQAGLENSELELRVVRGGLLVKPVKVKPVKAPRQGWDEEVKAAVERGEATYDLEWLEADLGSELE